MIDFLARQINKQLLSSNRSAGSSHLDKSPALNVETLEPRFMLSSTVEIFAAGQTGAEELTLLINDQVVETFDNLGTGASQGDFQRLVFHTDQNVSAGDIKIEFNNDAFDPATGADNNLTVDRIVIDGETFVTNSDDVFSIGSFLGGEAFSGFRVGDTLYQNGFFNFGGVGENESLVTVFARGSTSEETFDVRIDDEVVATFDVGAPTRFTRGFQILVDQPVSPGQVSVAFVNDLFDPENGIDRNLIVERINIDGTFFDTDSPNVFSTGTYVPGVGITEGFLQTDTLHANGAFFFSDSDVDTTPPVVTLVDTTDVTLAQVSAVEFTVSVTDNFDDNLSPPGGDPISVIASDGTVSNAFLSTDRAEPDGSLTARFRVNAPNGGVFTAADNGTYQIVLNGGFFRDAQGNTTPGSTLGTFEVNIPPQTDFTRPTATITSNTLDTNINDGFVFTVEVADDVAVGTIADQPITIFGPDFFETTPRLVSNETDFRGVPSPVRTLTFSIARPGGFSSANNGTYLVVVNGSTIFDAAGNPVNGGPIGELELRI